MIVLYSGIADKKDYITWKDESGVSHITEELSEIPENKRSESKFYSNSKKLSFINKMKDFPFYKIVFALISIFILLILIQNAGENIQEYISNKNKSRTDNINARSGILNLTKDEFKNKVTRVFEEYEYSLTSAKGVIKYSVDFIALKKGINHTVSILYSDNPVTEFALNNIVRDFSNFDCKKHIAITNNYFSKEAAEFAKTLNLELIDRDLFAEMIVKKKIRN